MDESKSVSTLTTIFVTPGERRLRAGWRLLLQFVLLVLLTGFFGLAAGLLSLAGGDTQSDVSMLLSTVAQLLAVTLSVRLARRFFDRRSMGTLGLYRAHAGRDLLFGFGLAGAMLGSIYLFESAAGWVRFEGFGWEGGRAAQTYAGVLVWLAIFVMVGWYEELLARGYWLVNLTEGLNRWAAAILTSLAFSAGHLANPNASAQAAAGLFFAGLLFAYAAFRSGALWLPVGLHIGWNIFEGVVFGFPVSGLATTNLIRQAPVGPALWTGGAFGPEAGLVLLPALGLGALAILGWTRGRGLGGRGHGQRAAIRE